MAMHRHPQAAPISSVSQDNETSAVGSFLDTTVGRFVVAAGAVAGTLLTARDSISRAYFKSMNKTGADAFTDLQRDRDRQIGEVVAPARQGIPVQDAMQKVQQINSAYDVKLAERSRLLGVNNVFDEMRALKRHQWAEVLLSTSAVAAVALGAIFTIASNRDLVHKAEKDDDSAEKVR